MLCVRTVSKYKYSYHISMQKTRQRDQERMDLSSHKSHIIVFVLFHVVASTRVQVPRGTVQARMWPDIQRVKRKTLQILPLSQNCSASVWVWLRRHYGLQVQTTFKKRSTMKTTHQKESLRIFSFTSYQRIPQLSHVPTPDTRISISSCHPMPRQYRRSTSVFQRCTILR